MSKYSFAGRTVLVTGGTRGIGREFVRQLVDECGQVLIVGRNQQDLDAVVGDSLDKVKAFRADLSSAADVDALILRLNSEHPELSVLINNAGIQIECDCFEADSTSAIANARQEIAINLGAVVSLTLGCLPTLVAHRGMVLNVSSGLAVAPKEAAPVYCATKAGLRSFSIALRYQSRTHGDPVRVVEAIMPLVDTDMTKGRGSGKLRPSEAAAQVLQGARAGRSEVWVGKARVLRLINRLSPALAARILR